MPNNRKIDSDFINFIAEEVKNVKSPMNLSKLCREFKKKNGTSSSDSKLFTRLQKIRDKMSEIENFDIDTKVKMIFALGSPVSNGLLIELKKQANIELDEQHCIIKYKKNGSDLQLSGVHLRSCDTGIEKKMLKFLAEKSEKATSPMIDKAFLKEFNSSEGNCKADNCFYTRYNLFKQQIYLSPEFDQETKIKMIFVSNTKVHASILEELRQNAVVEVDEHKRITKYEANNGSLKLEGKRTKISISLKSTTPWSKEEEEKILSFVAEKSKQTKVPLVVQHLIREIAEKSGVSRTKDAVELHFYQCLIPKISKLANFDKKTRMRMLFALNVPVDEEFLNELREEAFVEVDEHQRITKYEANDGKLKLETKRLPPHKEWSKEEDDKLLNFIVEKSKQANAPLFINSLSREFVEKNGISRTMHAVQVHLHKYVLPKVSKLDGFNTETKIRMIFALSVSVDEEFLNKLRKEASVKIDEKRRITKYKANDGSLELRGDHSSSAKQKILHAQKKSRSINSKATETDGETEDSDDEDDEEEDVVEEDSKPNKRSGRLSKKRLSDNHFFSDSDDSSCESSGKVRKSKNRKTEKITRKRRNTYFSETDGETEDEENEEKYEEKEEFEANSSTRRSERISKQRYPDVGFDDDVSFDSPENGNGSSVEKKTEKLVAKSSNFSSKAPLVKNQKRKIVENPSDDTSSSSKSKKYGRLADTQNDTGSGKTTSGAKKNDTREAIKQESLSHKKVKLENEEYKPDRSLLSNTIQNNMQILSGTEVNRTDDVDQSSGNTEEMTSGKEFMKSLACLVDTLDSPTLAKLQSKIEKAIKELGDRDHKIPTDEIARTIDNGLFLLNINAIMKPPTGEFTSLRDFFLIFRTTLSAFLSSSLNTFQLKLKANIKKLDGQDKFILLDTIETVLETVLLLIIP